MASGSGSGGGGDGGGDDDDDDERRRVSGRDVALPPPLQPPGPPSFANIVAGSAHALPQPQPQPPQQPAQPAPDPYLRQMLKDDDAGEARDVMERYLPAHQHPWLSHAQRGTCGTARTYEYNRWWSAIAGNGFQVVGRYHHPGTVPGTRFWNLGYQCSLGDFDSLIADVPKFRLFTPCVKHTSSRDLTLKFGPFMVFLEPALGRHTLLVALPSTPKRLVYLSSFLVGVNGYGRAVDILEDSHAAMHPDYLQTYPQGLIARSLKEYLGL